MKLHDKIMNLPSKHDNRQFAIAYKEGHRDARHAAAELALKYDSLIVKLFDALCNRHADDLVDELKEEYGL